MLGTLWLTEYNSEHVLPQENNPCRLAPRSLGDAQAASLAATLERALGIEVKLTVGAFGQFDVRVDDEILVSKTGPGLLPRLLGRGEFPDEEEVVQAVKRRLAEIA